jgi:hypothetical protein
VGQQRHRHRVVQLVRRLVAVLVLVQLGERDQVVGQLLDPRVGRIPAERLIPGQVQLPALRAGQAGHLVPGPAGDLVRQPGGQHDPAVPLQRHQPLAGPDPAQLIQVVGHLGRQEQPVARGQLGDPVPPNQPASVALVRKPMARPTPATRTTPTIVWITLPSTCPVSSDTRAMAMVRNRATMPSVMSMQTDTAVDTDPEATVSTRMPGTR